MIHEAFNNSLSKFQVPGDQMISLWNQVEKKYKGSKRFYHNLNHLNNFLAELIPLKSQFKSWEIIVLAIVYHDIIYKAHKGNNEEKSAVLAEERLKSLSLPEDLIQYCADLIIATKSHESTIEEIKLFTDADLSIFGASPQDYQTYSEQIRKEYSIYPDILYFPGKEKSITTLFK